MSADERAPGASNLTAEGGEVEAASTTRRLAAAIVGVVASGIVLGVLIVEARSHSGWLHRLDVSTADHLNSYLVRHPGQESVWKAITDLGGPLTWRALALLASVVLLIQRRWRAAITVAAGMIGAAVLSGTVKVAVGRVRPTVPHPLVHVGGGSFPSGHALTSFVALGLLVVLAGPLLPAAARTALTALAAALVLLVGFSRLILGAHYLTDVLGAWLVGALWLTVVVAAVRRAPHTSG